MISDVMADTTARMDRAVEAAKDDFATVRTGRANPQLFQKILVDYYGSPTPINGHTAGEPCGPRQCGTVVSSRTTWGPRPASQEQARS